MNIGKTLFAQLTYARICATSDLESKSLIVVICRIMKFLQSYN